MYGIQTPRHSSFGVFLYFRISSTYVCWHYISLSLSRAREPLCDTRVFLNHTKIFYLTPSCRETPHVSFCRARVDIRNERPDIFRCKMFYLKTKKGCNRTILANTLVIPRPKTGFTNTAVPSTLFV